MTTETKVEQHTFELNPGGQWDFFHSKAPFPAYIAGRGSGKTAGAILKVFAYCYDNPGAMSIITEPTMPLVHTILMPRFRNLFGSWEGALWRLTGKGSGQEQIEFLRPPDQIGVPRDSVILLRAALEPEKLVGFEFACGNMDEPAETIGGSQELAFLNLVGGLRQKGFKNMFLSLTSTPKGYNWVWRSWHDEAGKLRPGHALFGGTALENKANLDEGYWERLKAEHGENSPRWRQEALGEFVFVEGLVYGDIFDPKRHIRPFPENVPFVKRLGGIDFGVHSPTAVVEGRMDAGRRVYIKERLYRRDCRDDELLSLCGQMMKEGTTRFICDPSGKDRIEWLRRNGVPARKAKSNLIGLRTASWSTRFVADSVYITTDSPNLIREIGGLAWAPSRGVGFDTDKFDKNTPDHLHDAGADLLQDMESAVPIGMEAPELRVSL